MAILKSSLSNNQHQHAEKNLSITITRVISMLMIIVCHLLSWLDISFLAMILNVGVYIFLIISGILYSNKSIDDAVFFIKRRWEKLCIPDVLPRILFSRIQYVHIKFGSIQILPNISVQSARNWVHLI